MNIVHKDPEEFKSAKEIANEYAQYNMGFDAFEMFHRLEDSINALLSSKDTELEQHKKAIAAFEAERVIFSKELEQAKKEIVSHNQNFTAFQKIIKEKNEEIEGLQKRFLKLETEEYFPVKELVYSQQKEIEELKKEKDFLKKTYFVLSSEFEALNSENDRLKEENIKLEKQSTCDHLYTVLKNDRLYCRYCDKTEPSI